MDTSQSDRGYHMATTAQVNAYAEQYEQEYQNLATKLQVFGATGRISDIIGKVGYNKLIDHMEAVDQEKLELLYKFVGWAIEYNENYRGG